ncbi:MAG: hypothetical protein BEH78_13545 [Pseudomonas sp. BDAL1]|nr:MAG: hypothetical protein BEH78_13545 [Pseudomonas sp. BDAL1]
MNNLVSQNQLRVRTSIRHPERFKNRSIKIFLVCRGGSLRQNDRPDRFGMLIDVALTVIFHKMTDDCGFTIVGVTDDQQVRHSWALRCVEKGFQSI